MNEEWIKNTALYLPSSYTAFYETEIYCTRIYDQKTLRYHWAWKNSWSLWREREYEQIQLNFSYSLSSPPLLDLCISFGCRIQDRHSRPWPMKISLDPRCHGRFTDALLICLGTDWWKQLRRSRGDTLKTFLCPTKIYGHHSLNCSPAELIFHARILRRCSLSRVIQLDGMNLEGCRCNSLFYGHKAFANFQWEIEQPYIFIHPCRYVISVT